MNRRRFFGLLAAVAPAVTVGTEAAPAAPISAPATFPPGTILPFFSHYENEPVMRVGVRDFDPGHTHSIGAASPANHSHTYTAHSYMEMQPVPKYIMKRFNGQSWENVD